MSLLDSYEAVLWKTMDWLRITDSVRRKMLAAVAIQFSVAIGLFSLPFVVSGTVLTAIQAVLFTGATVAFINTALIVQRDLIEPLGDIETAAGRIADGHVETAAVATDQPDEVGELTRSFSALQSYLTTVAAQADALAEQEFDDDALDESVPGPFGESLTRMADSLETHTTEIEARSARLERLVDAFEESTTAAIDGDLTATIDPAVVNDTDGTYTVVIDRYNELLATLQASLGETAAFAAEVSQSTDSVAERTAELDRAGKEIATATDEIAAGADEQRDQLQAAVNEVNTLSATVEEIAASAEEVSRTADTASEAATEGRERSKPPVPARRAMGSQSSPRRSKVSPRRQRMPPVRSPTASKRFRPNPTRRSPRSNRPASESARAPMRLSDRWAGLMRSPRLSPS